MTREKREDAIDIIQSILNKYEEDECLVTEITIGNEDIKAFKMTIEALEQEPCEDAISRKALIERINNAEENFKADNMESIGSDDRDPFVDGVLSGVFNIREMVIQAPSVTPQEPILEKIRAEIEDCLKALDEIDESGLNIYSPNEMSGRRLTYQQCLEFIDKYREGGEENDGVRSL